MNTTILCNVGNLLLFDLDNDGVSIIGDNDGALLSEGWCSFASWINSVFTIISSILTIEFAASWTIFFLFDSNPLKIMVMIDILRLNDSFLSNLYKESIIDTKQL